MEKGERRMKGLGVLGDKTLKFAIRIVNLNKYLQEKKEYTLSNQILRSGTAIGALAREAQHAQSKLDFLSKVNIALKEANETDYWLTLLFETEYIPESIYMSFHDDCEELIKILVAIVKTTKISTNKN